MGLIRTRIRLANPARRELTPLDTVALADTGSLYLALPEHLAIQLSLEYLEYREVTLAGGSRRRVPYAGPVQVQVNPESPNLPSTVAKRVDRTNPMSFSL